ncbi:MAG: ANTAR domain-containing protein [Nocardioidaceae bacterium]
MIGQAQGIPMERYQLDADQAFRVLARVSQQTNTKVHQVASDIVATRHLPGVDDMQS